MDERSLPEIGRTVDRHERKISDIEQHYVSEKVLLAMLTPIGDRVLRLEQDDTSKTRGNRSAWLAVISATGTAVVLEAVHALMRSSGR